MHTFSKQNLCGVVSSDDNGRVLPAEKEECLPGQDQVPFLSLELPGDGGDDDDDDDGDDDDSLSLWASCSRRKETQTSWNQSRA